MIPISAADYGIHKVFFTSSLTHVCIQEQTTRSIPLLFYLVQ